MNRVAAANNKTLAFTDLSPSQFLDRPSTLDRRRTPKPRLQDNPTSRFWVALKARRDREPRPSAPSHAADDPMHPFRPRITAIARTTHKDRINTRPLQGGAELVEPIVP